MTTPTVTTLPLGWTEMALGEVAEVNPRHFDTPPDDREISFVPMAAVEEETGRLDANNRRLYGEMRKKSYRRFHEGDVLVAKITPSMENGKAALAMGLEAGLGMGSTEFHVLRPSPGLDARYLLHYVLQKNFRADAARSMTGTAGQLRVPADFLREKTIPVPPIDEQRRIVEAIETHLSHLDAGVESLERAKRNVERMRVAVLRSAVEGRLVRHTDLGRSAEELLAQVVELRRSSWKSIERRSRYRDPVEVHPLAPVPDHWVVAAMDTLAYTRLGKMLSKKAKTGSSPKPYLRNQNVQWGHFDLEDVAEMDILSDEEERYRLQPGDLLVCEGGEVGRCAIWNDDTKEMYYQKALHRVRPYSGVSPSWLALVLKYLASNRLLGDFVTGSTIDHLPQEDLRMLPVPLPPPVEQEEILAEVDRQASLLDGLERDLSVGVSKAGGLRSAVLSHAFSGKLLSAVREVA